MSFEGKPDHLISASQIDAEVLENILEVTESLNRDRTTFVAARQELSDIYRDDVMGIAMTFEPSSRTRRSFIRAAESLGVKMLNEANPKEDSSTKKGESLEDTIIEVNANGYNVIVLRTEQSGLTQLAADHSNVPVLSAGDGDGEHPTQAVADAKTIIDHFGLARGLTVAHIGDPWNSRTVHSQIDVLKPFGAKHIFSAIPELSESSYQDKIKNLGVEYEVIDDEHQALEEADVVDISRFQAARQQRLPGESKEDYEARLEALRAKYLNATLLDARRVRIIEADPDKIMLHPFPRNEEIPIELTYHRQGKWIEQMQNGMLTRRAILYMALTNQLFAKEVRINGLG